MLALRERVEIPGAGLALREADRFDLVRGHDEYRAAVLPGQILEFGTKGLNAIGAFVVSHAEGA